MNNEEFDNYLKSIGARMQSIGGGDWPCIVMVGNQERPHRALHLTRSEEVATMPEGTVVVWIDDLGDGQAGVLQTADGYTRAVAPSSVRRSEDHWDLAALPQFVWVIPFDDPPEGR